MKNKTQTKKMVTNKRSVIIGGSLVAGIIVVICLYQFVFKPDAEQSQGVTQKNVDNAAAIRTEKDKEPVVITNDSPSNQSEPQDDAVQPPADSGATIDESGVSTNIDRAEVRPAVGAVLAVYQDFLAKMRAVPVDQLQSAADQYLTDHSGIFSPTFPYLSSNSIHLFPQSAGIALPESVSIHSAIKDPDNPSQTIVQVFMPPDATWSLLVLVKMKSDATLGTIEKLIIRNNQNPL